MAATNSNTDEVLSQSLMKIQSTNYQVDPTVSAYPEDLKMLIVALKRSLLSTAMFRSFPVPMVWLSRAASTASYNHTADVITFNLINNKRVKLSKNLFVEFLQIPNNPPFVKPVNSQIIHMFNEMGHQPELEKISDFRKSGLPCIWNFLFGIFLRCLTGRSVGLDRGRVEVYAMVMGIYYDINVDYATQLWKEFVKSLENTNSVKGISCARYWSLILEKVYEKEAIPIMQDVEVAEFSFYQFPKVVEDDEAIFTRVARIPDAMLRKVSPTHKVLVRYLRNIDTADQTGVLPDVATPSKKKKVSKKSVKGSPIVQDEVVPTEKTLSKSKKEILPSKSGVLKQIRKAEVSSKGVTIRSIPAPVSPGKKRQRVEDVAKNMQRTLVKRRKMVIRNESSDEEVVPKTPPVTTMVNVSLPILSTSQISTTISQTQPLEIVLTKSVTEEVPISDMVVNVSDTGAPIASTIQTSLPITTLSTTSSIFDHALQNPFTTLFPSQSPENPPPSQQMSDPEVEGGAFGGILDDIPFDSDEEDIPDHMLMTGKQFKILNQKLKAIIQSQADSGRMSLISAMEVDVMIKGAEKRIMEKVYQTDKNNELRVKAPGNNFTSAVQDLKAATKERHILFVQDVKKVREDVNFKIQELKSELAKDLQDVHTRQEDLQKQIVEISSQLHKLNNIPVVEDQKAATMEKFDHLIKLVTELKSAVSHSSSSQILTPEFLSLKINTLEQAIQKALAPLSNFTSLLPKSAPPVFTGVQGGEKSRSKEDEAKTVGKMISTQLVATLPIPTKPISSTTITTKTISKGIVIGENEGGSSSKPQKDVTGKGKGILYEKSKEELKADAEAELERMRQVQSIMRQRASDPPSMNKGDPAKLYSYETIESKVVGREMYEFEKKPKRSYDIANSDHCQLDFPINEMLFITTQYKISEKFDNPDDYTHMKIRFHVVLGKNPDEVWSLMKIKKVLTIKNDVLFEDMLQNFRYFVIRADNKQYDFTVADFPLMNCNDLIQVALILKHMEENKLKGSETDVFKVGFAQVKTYIDNYFDCLALTNDELANVLGREVKVPWEDTLTPSALSKYVVGEICLKPFGMVFSGRDTKGKPKKFLFKASEIERYNSSQYTHFIVRMSNCKKNNEGDKKDLKKVISWYGEVRRTIHSAIQKLLS
ncbi:hypothetical protein Lser_V15G24877 [Lactuca serriola]